jgi:diguanylate cyclase (GGDEF)-like protein/PAS domain S-box-containing protein
VWFEVTNHNLLNDPAHGYILTEMLDVSDEMAAQEALRAREHLLRRLTDALPYGIFQVDTRRRIVYCNAALESIVGTTSADDLSDLLASVVSSDRAALNAALDAVLVEGRDRDLEVGFQREHGEVRRCTLSLRALTDDASTLTGAIACLVDVTESVRLREELEDRATFDVLTRCYNRASILALLEHTLVDRSLGDGGVGVIFIDLDRFKDINDRLGHSAGDAFLAEVAKRLASSVRSGDVVGRLGGDEFLVVCAHVQSADGALDIGNRIADALAQGPVAHDGQLVVPIASIGVAWSEQRSVDSDTLVACADRAMYESKRLRRGRPVLSVVDPSLADAA